MYRLGAMKIRNLAKKILMVIGTLFVATAFLGCAKSGAKNASGGKKIMASFYPLYVMLLNITSGSDAELSLLASPDTGCLHDYQLTTGDMKNLEAADILVLNGAGMEDFVEKALEVKDESQIVTACEGYQLFEDNAHVWLSPKGAAYEVEKISEGLSRLDEKNAALYEENARYYIEKILSLNEEMHSVLDEFAGKKIITFHEAFPYFAKEFNLEIVGVIEREAGTEPNAKELKELIEIVNEEKNKSGNIYLFAEEQYSSSASEIISEETGLKVYQLDPCVSGRLYADAYLDSMKKNLLVLQEAFEN